jgi:CelD/BcsL family acetyltransferase involved in cellulose biosynthesis
MFEHQAQRLAEFGVHGVFGVTEKEFVHLLADEQNEGHSFLLPYALKCDGRTLAVTLGGRHREIYWALSYHL